MERLLYEVKKVIVGQDHLLERMAVALLARGHILVEGVPGLAKTMAIKTLAGPSEAISSASSSRRTRPGGSDRHPDLQPEDRRVQHVAGSGVHQPPARGRDQQGSRQSPERAARGDAGAAGHDRPRDHKVPDPFLVLATQNPIETEGTYALPEAQVDRFMLKVLVGYPSATESSSSWSG